MMSRIGSKRSAAGTTAPLSCRIPVEIDQQIKQMAAAEDRSIGYITSRLIKQAIEANNRNQP